MIREFWEPMPSSWLQYFLHSPHIYPHHIFFSHMKSNTYTN
ncbi:hypothetical protein ACJIZ3_001923 [Penstemon smallii]|uniref:Uncharacterized protein n=1 Tax=Penstemon smallii TaxID=265156 RepID=A0ABD3U5B6_9LAMI